MNRDELLQTIILDRVFRENNFTKVTLEKYSDDPELREDAFAEIEKLKSYCELISDRARTMNNATLEHFMVLLNKQYDFSNPLVYAALYDYGMFVSR